MLHEDLNKNNKKLFFVIGQLQCWIDLEDWQWQIYMTLITLALLVIPAIIISACYTVIVWTIWSKSRLLMPVQHPHCQRRRSTVYIFLHYSFKN